MQTVAASKKKIVFLTRNAIVHQLGGSTTVVLNLMQVLAGHNVKVTMIVTSAYGRSPSLFFRQRMATPEGVTVRIPGFLHVGSWYLNLLSARAWARAFLRFLSRHSWLAPLVSFLVRVAGGRLMAEAWDLSPPTEAEICASRREITRLTPDVVIVNYAFWAPLFAALRTDPSITTPRNIILMHDLLSARVAKFVASGIPLDCPYIAEPTELEWLDQADFVLAAQKTEAEYVASRVSSRVLVQPIVMRLAPTTEQPDPNRCLFVGTNIQPNVTGIRWFLDEVWPMVLEHNPRATLRIAGRVCEMLPATYPRATLLGIVPSLAEEMGLAGVCLVPLLMGSGIKVKLLEALALGKACVATPIGVQGLEGWTEGAVAVAEDARGFAAAVAKLMLDEDARRHLETGARTLIETHFGPESAAALEFITTVLGEPHRRENRCTPSRE